MHGLRSLASLVGALVLLSVGCAQDVTQPSDSIAAPAVVGTIQQLTTALRAQGLSVTMGGQTSPSQNHYFSVSSRDVTVDGALLKVFEYETVEKAASDAALVSKEGQPNPRAAFGWTSQPNFYSRGRLIVLYVGCGDIRTTLEELLGPAFAQGPGCR